MDECIFCKIARGEVPVDPVMETDRALVFPDIHPEAPVHLLVIPKQHLDDIDAAHENEDLLGHLLSVAAQAARKKGLLPGGYRIISNIGPDAGQTVGHLHLHVMGGRILGWPAG